MIVPAEPLRFLDDEEMRKIHETAVRVLDSTGTRIDSDRALDYLRDAGCRVDRDRRRVTFPPEVTERCVDKMRRSRADSARMPERMAVRFSHIRFRNEPYRIHPDFSVSTGGFCVFVHDLEGVRRTATMQDVRDSLRLADALDQIDLTGLPVSAQDVPHRLRPTVMAAELAKTTKKLGGIETFDVRDVEYITRIAEVVAGGKEELRRHPVLVGYAEMRSPLCLDGNMAEIFMAYIERGLPQTLDTMPNGGATAPMAAAGILALGAAESMVGLVLAYAIDEAAVVGLDMIPSYADMRSGIFRYAGAERWPLLGARLQLLNEFYACPAGVHGGKTDACVPGVQVGIEKAASLLMPVLCGAVGVGTVGHLENAVTFSPEQLVIDSEVAGYVRRMLRGCEVNDETLAAEVIERVGIGGEYLTDEHTLRHFRKELHDSPLFERAPWAHVHETGLRGMQERARARVKEILSAEPRSSPLAPDQIEAIDEIVDEAKRELGEE